MTAYPSLLHMYCIDAREHLSELESETWKQTGLVRWHNLTAEMDWTEALREAAHVYAFLWPGGLLKGSMAAQIGYPGLRKVTWVKSISSRVLDRNGNIDGLSVTQRFDKAQLVADMIKRHNIARAGPAVEWDSHDMESRLAKSRFDREGISLVHVLEKYFPGDLNKAHVQSVGGGWSGSPLLSALLNGDNYFFKFFDPAPFRKEWEAHEQARAEWLRDLTVEIVRIPDLPDEKDEVSQHETAFSGQRHVICYRRAKSTKRLDEIYANVPDSARLAYEKVLSALQTGNEDPVCESIPLHRLADIGPPFASTPASSLLDSLSCDPGVAPIRANLERMKRYGMALFKEEWTKVDSTLREFLRVQVPDALREGCPCMMGHVHGDANARNFLFDGTRTSLPDGLQIVDCGGYKQNAPLVFDLAQLEADLKFVLMGTEEQSGYKEIDPTFLQEDLAVEEKRAIDASLAYRGSTSTDESLRRCYNIVGLIRERAQRISRGDEYGRAYLYCLLYWTLRKTRLPGRIHSVKCIFAFYSAGLIIRKLEDWASA
jgi:hypothetical protein